MFRSTSTSTCAVSFTPHQHVFVAVDVHDQASSTVADLRPRTPRKGHCTQLRKHGRPSPGRPRLRHSRLQRRLRIQDPAHFGSTLWRNFTNAESTKYVSFSVNSTSCLSTFLAFLLSQHYSHFYPAPSAPSQPK